jgi:hypothetical protein
MEPPHRTGGNGTELLEFVLVIAAVLGGLAVVVVIVGVSLPTGLKFVLAVVAAMLSTICFSLGVILQHHGRRL